MWVGACYEHGESRVSLVISVALYIWVICIGVALMSLSLQLSYITLDC